MSNLLTKIKGLKDDVNQLIKLQYTRLKFEVIESVAKERAKIYLTMVTIVILFLIVFFVSLFAAHLINDFNSSLYLGFGVVSLFWILVVVFFLIFKKRIIRLLDKKFIEQNIPVSEKDSNYEPGSFYEEKKKNESRITLKEAEIIDKLENNAVTKLFTSADDLVSGIYNSKETSVGKLFNRIISLTTTFKRITRISRKIFKVFK